MADEALLFAALGGAAATLMVALLGTGWGVALVGSYLLAAAVERWWVQR